MKDEFIKNGQIIHIDIDESELGYNIKHTQTKIHADVRSFLETINHAHHIYPDFSDWYDTIKKIRKLLPLYSSDSLYEYIHPNYFFSEFSKLTPEYTVYVNDVGQNQMWASQSLTLKK